MEIKLLDVSIERAINDIGAMTGPELKGAVPRFPMGAAKLAPKVQWEHSCAKDKTLWRLPAEEDEGDSRACSSLGVSCNDDYGSADDHRSHLALS
jgi:hypothetical protein